MHSIRTRAVSTVLPFLVAAYLATWSAALVYSLVIPPSGSGRVALATAKESSREKPQITFAERRHTPLVKSISLVAPPPSDFDFPQTLHALTGRAYDLVTPLPADPPYSPSSGRSPPAC